MTDIDQIVRRAVDTITTIARTVSRFATKLLMATIVICVGGFLLGIAALSGGIETVWIVLGIVFGSIAIGGMAIAVWRIRAVRRHVPELAAEIRTLMVDGRDPSRTVVETFAVGAEEPLDGERETSAGSAIVLSRQMASFRSVGSGLAGSVRLSAAVAALTRFPAIVLAAVAISVVFAFTGFVFLIALAL